MSGYNPHNMSHEYHASNGGCVSDAKRAEAKALGQIGSGIANVAEHVVPSVICYPVDQVIPGMLCEATSAMAIDSAKAFVKSKISHEIKSNPNANGAHGSLARIAFLCSAHLQEENMKMCIREQREKIPELAGVSEEFLLSYIHEEYEMQLAGYQQHHNDDNGCAII